MLQKHFNEFYEDIFAELEEVGGKLEQLEVCENMSDHLTGNVYCKFAEEEDAARALQNLTGRFYAGRPILAQFCPVMDFKDARCRQFEEAECARGGYCNFMHLKQISDRLYKKIWGRSRRSMREHEREREREERGYGGGRGDDRRGGGRDDRGGGDVRCYSCGGTGHYSRDCPQGGSRGDDRRHDDRDRDRRRERSRSPRRDDRRDTGSGGNLGRDNSEERRRKIAEWNAKREGAEQQ